MKYIKNYKKFSRIIKKTNIILPLLLSASLIITSTVFADVLGTHISSDRKQIAPGTDLYTNVFNSSSVGKQTEHYFEYTPNENSVPVLTNGQSAYGKRTLSQANSVLTNQGYNTAAGMNADFFSFQTGVPMSNTIIDGRVYTADSSWLPAIGFRDDGTAYIGTLPINITAKTSDGASFKIECVNKYRQPYALYLFTNDFADNTHSPDKGQDIILGNISGDLRLGEDISATVESISDNDGSVPIPDGKFVLSVSADASQDIKDRLSGLNVGTKITLSVSTDIDINIWKEMKYALGCLGGKLLTDGKLDFEDESAAPRTAVGIKADGSIIFYTIDGRQSGYSYGARKETVAKRLLELGCTDAVSLDGGGSTTMGYSELGSKEFKIINSPSEGSVRSCANFLFVVNTARQDGVARILTLDNYGTILLSGASVDISVTSALDNSYNYASIPSDITYTIERDADTPAGNGKTSTISDNGFLTAYGNGDIYIAASGGDAYGSTKITTVSTPEEIKIYNANAGYELNEIAVEPNSAVQLDAVSTWYGITAISDSSCYSWTIVNDGDSVGSVDGNGYFKASDISGATGKLVVNAGMCVREVPVRILGDNENSELVYPEISIKSKNNTLTAYVLGEDIKKTNISVSVDGKKTDFDYNDATHSAIIELSDNSYHRIGFFVTSENGASAMKFYETGNITSLENKFSDTANHWAKGYISYLADCGVVNGSLDEDDKIFFRPDSQMTRTEFAIMLCNYLGISVDDYSNTTLPFIDNGEIPWWAENYVKAIYSLGIMQGQLGQYGVSFSPNANINRMEFAIALNRLLPSGLSSAPITSSDKSDIPFWAEESMKVICAQGIMTGYPDGTLRPVQSVTRAEAVKMLFNIFGA